MVLHHPLKKYDRQIGSCPQNRDEHFFQKCVATSRKRTFNSINHWPSTIHHSPLTSSWNLQLQAQGSFGKVFHFWITHLELRSGYPDVLGSMSCLQVRFFQIPGHFAEAKQCKELNQKNTGQQLQKTSHWMLGFDNSPRGRRFKTNKCVGESSCIPGGNIPILYNLHFAILVGGFNPSEKYYIVKLVKLDHFPR